MENTTEKLPLISILIPSYNCAKTIGITLQSMMDQTYPNIEIIVIDDGSTDDTENVVKEYQARDPRIQYFKIVKDDAQRVNSKGRNINAGWSARNYGFSKCAGEWIVFQDADDASFLNRVEMQYRLAKKHGSSHVCGDWVRFDPTLLGKKIDGERFLRDHPEALIGTQEILAAARRSKGVIPKVLGPLHRYIPFKVKQMRGINRLFFGTLEPYPGTGQALVKKSVVEKILFRKREDRVWPSFVGRGADRDFNFNVASTFRDSISVNIPITLWNVPNQNPDFEKYAPYIC